MTVPRQIIAPVAVASRRKRSSGRPEDTQLATRTADVAFMLDVIAAAQTGGEDERQTARLTRFGNG